MSFAFGRAAVAQSFNVKCYFAFDLPCQCAVSHFTRGVLNSAFRKNTKLLRMLR